MTVAEMPVFETLESNVRGYCRCWPAVFDTASGVWLRDENGKEYLDFFAGAGSLNYGHNNPVLKRALLDYIAGDGITHGLDMSTVAKRRLLERRCRAAGRIPRWRPRPLPRVSGSHGP